MAFYIYNTKNRILNAEKLTELLSFVSNDFAGIIAEDWVESCLRNPTVYIHDETDPENIKDYWTWNQELFDKQVTFMGGGVNIGYDVPSPVFSSDLSGLNKGYWPCEDKCLFGLDVILSDSNSSISSNVGNVSIISIPYTNISKVDVHIVVSNPYGNPSEKGYYEYDTDNDTYVLTEDTEVIPNKVYYYVVEKEAFKVEEAIFPSREDGIRVNNAVTFEYYGNTIWIQKNINYNGSKADRFFIPICYSQLDGTSYEYESMIFRRDKSGYESFLSARTYYNLLSELNTKYVYRSGGEEVGDIGKLNITDNTLKRNDSNSDVVDIHGLYLHNIPVIDNSSARPDRQYVSNLLTIGGVDSSYDDELYSGSKKGRIYRSSDNFVIDRSHGGTGALDIDEARNNLHIMYGDNIPTDNEELSRTPGYTFVRPTKLNGSIDYGAIWFKLL